MTEDVSTEASLPRADQDKPGLFSRWLIWSNVSSPFLALVYLFAFFWLTIGAAEAARQDSAAPLFFVSLGVVAFCYYACRRVALLFFIFGAELGGPPHHRLRRLWKLAARYYGLTGFIVLVASPIVAGFGPRWLVAEVDQPAWVLPVNLLLLHWLFAVVAVYHYIDMEPRRLQQTIRILLFPFRVFSMVFEQPSVLLLVLPLSWIVKGLQEQFDRFLLIMAAGTDVAVKFLLSLDALGPAVLYLINPLHLAMTVHTGDDPSAGSPYAFMGVTLLLLILIVLRLRQLLFIIWDQGYADFYNEWLLNRLMLANQYLSDPAYIRNPAEDPENSQPMGHPHPEGAEETPVRSQGNVVSATHLTLPSESAHVFVSEIITAPAPILNKPEAAALFLMLLAIPVFGNAMWLALLGVWLLISCTYAFPAGKHTWITPQPVWPVLRRLLVKKIIPYWPGDVVLSLLLVLLTKGNWISGLVTLIVLISFRVVVLGVKLTYSMQSRLIFLALLSVLIHIVMGSMSVVFLINPAQSGPSPWPLVVALVFGVIQWLITWAVLHLKYNHLLHFAPANRYQN